MGMGCLGWSPYSVVFDLEVRWFEQDYRRTPTGSRQFGFKMGQVSEEKKRDYGRDPLLVAVQPAEEASSARAASAPPPALVVSQGRRA